MYAIACKVVGRGCFVLLAAIALHLGLAAGDMLSLEFLLGVPLDLGRSGGIAPLLLNTLMMVSVAIVLATVVAFPAGLMHSMSAGKGGPVRIYTRVVMEVGVGMPRLLWGLVGAVVFVGFFGYSFAAGALTLACLLVPILFTSMVIGLERAADEMLPDCRALGMPPGASWFRVILPKATPALSASVVLAVGRALGDAAALTLTAGVSLRLATDLGDSARTLAVHVLQMATVIPGGHAAAMATGLVLLVMTGATQGLIAYLEHKRME